MHIIAHQKALGARDAEGLHADPINIDFPTTSTQDEAFAALAASLALAGHTLSRNTSADGAASYYAGRWGTSRRFDDLDAAAQFLATIGGGL